MGKVHKTIEDAAKHLQESAAVIPGRYKESTAKATWAEPAASDQATTNYNAGIAESEAKGLRVSGIREAGDAGYRKGCADKGAAVIGTRITAAIPQYRTKFSPVLQAMNSASDAAPAKTRDFMTNINNRLIPVVKAAKGAVGKV